MLNPLRVLSLACCAALALWVLPAPHGRAAERIPAAAVPATPPAAVATLLSRDLISGPEKEVVMLSVQYPAAGASLPHRHDAQVFVYVLEGRVTMQVRGSAAVSLNPGDTFYEGPDDVHIVASNNSTTASAKILVVMIKDKAKPASRAADSPEAG